MDKRITIGVDPLLVIAALILGLSYMTGGAGAVLDTFQSGMIWALYVCAWVFGTLFAGVIVLLIAAMFSGRTKASHPDYRANQ